MGPVTNITISWILQSLFHDLQYPKFVAIARSLSFFTIYPVIQLYLTICWRNKCPLDLLLCIAYLGIYNAKFSLQYLNCKLKFFCHVLNCLISLSYILMVGVKMGLSTSDPS